MNAPQFLKTNLFLVSLVLLLTSCGSPAILSTPVENIDNTPLKFTELTEEEKQNWMHLDFVQDTIPGMSVDKAYKEIIKNRKGKTTIVAVLDSGIDIRHEDLDGVVWINKGEVAKNGKDDDNNGYVDDINGWNFLGDTYYEQLEFVRLLSSGNKNHPRYAEAQAEYNKERKKYSELKSQYDQVLQQFNTVDKAISDHLYKPEYTREDLSAIKTKDETLKQYVAYMKSILGNNDFESNTEAKSAINKDANQISDRLNYNLNKTFKGRKTGDNPDDFSQVNYGDHVVLPKKPEENHGTHVAGIIAAERKNNRGIKGVANNALIMALRTTPRGDEYDKDVALAIRYAADNGAKIINTSFGKYFSPHSDKVRDAIVYAATKDVLIVNAAGNDANNLDVKNVFPNDAIDGSQEVADNFISVGAITSKTGTNMLADFSNYGKREVDIFAPGTDIYSTEPENGYDYMAGTSFAAPAVAGLAALIRSQHPELSAPQVKRIILDSGIKLSSKVLVADNTTKPFDQISKSGKIANAYNALLLAAQIAKTN